MKCKLMMGMGLALGLGMAVEAQAGHIFFADTVANWGAASPVLDTDADSTWNLVSWDSALDGALVTLQEEEFGGVDFYTVALNFESIGGIQDASYTLTYEAEQLGDEFFASAHLDSTHAGSGTSVVKEIYDFDTGALLLTLTSLDGVPEEGVYALTKKIKVVETYTVGTVGRLDGSTNTFDVKDVPAPLTPALLGLGLVGLGWMRRRAV